MKYLEENKIHTGLSEKLMRNIKPNSVSLSIWSPPYHVGKDYEKEYCYEKWKKMLSDVIKEHFDAIKPGGFMVINIDDILCFKDETMPRIQAPNISKRRSAVTREDVLAAKKKFPDYNRDKLAKYLGCSEQTVDRRLNGNNIRGGKKMTQTRVQLVGSIIQETAQDSGFYLYDRRVWKKDPTWANSQWHSNSYRAVSEFEYLYVFWKPGETVVDRKRLSKEEWGEWGSRGVWEFRSVQTNDKHEAMFPLELPYRFIKLLTEEGETVLDPFMGSGTTGVAASLLNRNYIGIDKESKYTEIARARIKKSKSERDSLNASVAMSKKIGGRESEKLFLMIKIKPVQWDWKECVACFSQNNVKQIVFGNSSNTSTTSIYLCEGCRKSLGEEFKKEKNGKEEK